MNNAVMINPLLRLVLLASALTLAGCGGGGSGGAGPAAQPATVGVALRDAPAPDFDQALATITSIQLLGESGPVTLFSGLETIDLLKLADYSELFAVSDTVPPGTYDKIRLQLSSLELTRLDSDGNVVESVLPKLVGNGKIDLNPRGPFSIDPGATLVVTIDFDVGKSLMITQTGNGKLIVRPVVFVDIAEGLPAPGLARIHGVISELGADSFRLCQTRLASDPGVVVDPRFADNNHCVRVRTDGDTGIFGSSGLPQEFFGLSQGEEATVVGRLLPSTDANASPEDRFSVEAVVIEEGLLGTFDRLAGTVAGPVDPGTDRFPLDLAPGQGLVTDGPLATQLFPKTRIFSRAGVELGRLDLETGTNLLADAVLAVSSGSDDVLRAALLVLDGSGAAMEVAVAGDVLSVDVAGGQLIVSSDTGDRCVDARGADVFLVSSTTAGLSSERGSLADLVPGQTVNVFGREGLGGCVVADTILADR